MQHITEKLRSAAHDLSEGLVVRRPGSKYIARDSFFKLVVHKVGARWLSFLGS